LEYQRHAIAAVVGVLEGQIRNSFDNSNLFGIQANITDLTPAQIEENKKRIIELLKQYIRDKEATFHLQFEKEKVLDEVLLKNGFMLDYTLTPQPDFKKNEVFLAKDAHKESLVCLDAKLEPETVDHFKTHKDKFFICLELALDTTKKWNLKHQLGEKLKAI
jgi:adenine-specific DNA-methyltransferase